MLISSMHLDLHVAICIAEILKTIVIITFIHSSQLVTF